MDTSSSAFSFGIGCLKRKHSGEILDGLSMIAMSAQGARIETDIPGRVMAALGILDTEQARAGIIYTPSDEQNRLMELIKKYGLTNQGIADRTATTRSTAERWSGDPWSARHSPIPKSKLLLLEASIRDDPPSAPSGEGRPRRS
ncbi:MAG: hypothetical protein HQM06_14010 [Magnetococcales bacterium]|nr:hypothetical protein [Magnetococcales bacterium]